MALTLGTRLGVYEILSVLGAGGMGVVYRARDSDHKPVTQIHIVLNWTEELKRLAPSRR